MLFYKNYIAYHNVYIYAMIIMMCSLTSVCIPSFVLLIGCSDSESLYASM